MIHSSMYLHDIIGLKRARADDTVDMLASIIDKVEQRATERKDEENGVGNARKNIGKRTERNKGSIKYKS